MHPAVYLHWICGVPMDVEGLGTIADCREENCFEGD